MSVALGKGLVVAGRWVHFENLGDLFAGTSAAVSPIFFVVAFRWLRGLRDRESRPQARWLLPFLIVAALGGIAMGIGGGVVAIAGLIVTAVTGAGLSGFYLMIIAICAFMLIALAGGSSLIALVLKIRSFRQAQ